MKNKEVVENYVNGGDEKSKTKHIFIEGKIIYSYGYHFPLCLKLLDGFIVNKDGYSHTTSRHKGDLLRAIENRKIIYLNTQKLKDVIALCSNEGILSIEDLKAKMVISEL